MRITGPTVFPARFLRDPSRFLREHFHATEKGQRSNLGKVPCASLKGERLRGSVATWRRPNGFSKASPAGISWRPPWCSAHGLWRPPRCPGKLASGEPINASHLPRTLLVKPDRHSFICSFFFIHSHVSPFKKNTSVVIYIKCTDVRCTV